MLELVRVRRLNLKTLLTEVVKTLSLPSSSFLADSEQTGVVFNNSPKVFHRKKRT